MGSLQEQSATIEIEGSVLTKFKMAKSHFLFCGMCAESKAHRIELRTIDIPETWILNGDRARILTSEDRLAMRCNDLYPCLQGSRNKDTIIYHRDSSRWQMLFRQINQVNLAIKTSIEREV